MFNLLIVINVWRLTLKGILYSSKKYGCEIYEEIKSGLNISNFDILFKNYDNIENKLFEKYNEYINKFNYLIVAIILLSTMILHILFHYFI